MHDYEVRPRNDKRGVDLIFDALPFGRLVVRRAKCSQQCRLLGESRGKASGLDRIIPLLKPAEFGTILVRRPILRATITERQ
jgi:hypothetical protein